MNILGIDASRSSTEKPTGVERYSNEIIKAILKNNVRSKNFELRFYSSKIIPFLPVKKQKIINFKRLWTLVGLSLEMLKNKPSVLFVPGHVLPFFTPKRSFVTIHDTAFNEFGASYGFLQKLYLKWSTWRAVKKCAGIFVPTEAVKKALIVEFKAKSKKIFVCPHGPLALTKVSEKEAIEILKDFGIGINERFFFYLGRIEKKKNIDGLLKAWKIVEKVKPGIKLIIGGSRGYGADEILKNISSSVTVTGYLSEKSVSALLSKSKALILPSHSEGFGFPILQAFEAETPMLCSDIPALREIAGSAALYANPMNSNEIAERIIELSKNPKLCFKLVEEGKNRLKKFSWENAARTVMSKLQIASNIFP